MIVYYKIDYNNNDTMPPKGVKALRYSNVHNEFNVSVFNWHVWKQKDVTHWSYLPHPPKSL